MKIQHAVQGPDFKRQESAATCVWGITLVSKRRWKFEDKDSIWNPGKLLRVALQN